MGRLLALIGALIAAGLIAWQGELTPAPAPANAPATAFSAARAMADVAAIAPVPHPIGTPANHAVRDRLLLRMGALGLSPRIHPGSGLWLPAYAPNVLIGGYVETIAGLLPGRDRSRPAVALMAHYDSVPGSPGGADDAAGVAAALETVRAIKAQGVPARDVIVLLTDGEEAGLLGAEAFFARDPMAGRIGFIFNLEARGSAGRTQMFQTSPRNGGAIRWLQAAVPRAPATSLSDFIYRHMPNNTDFTASLAAGTPGLNYAFIGRQFDYHAPSSTPATLDRGTLQDMGDQVLATARALAFSPSLPAPAPDLVYGQLPGGLLAAYPPAVGWAILLAAALLLGWALREARRWEPFPWLDLARGAGGGLVALVTAAAVTHFARKATGAAMGFMEQRFLLAQAPLWEAALVLLALGTLLVAAAELARGRRRAALLPLAAGLASCLIGGLDKVGLAEGLAGAAIAAAAYGRPVSRAGGWGGVLLLGLVVATAVQAAAPMAAFVFAWPLAWSALAAALTAASMRPGAATLPGLAVFAAVGLAFAGSFFHAGYLSLDLPELLALPVALAAMAVWPLAQTEAGAPPARLLGPALALAGLAVTMVVRFNHPYDTRHPRATVVDYQLDQDARQGWRYANAPERTAWTEAALTGGGGRIGRFPRGPRGKIVDAAPAAYVALPAPQISLVKMADGRLRLHVVPPPGARVMEVRLRPDTAATLESAGGAPVRLSLKPGAETLLSWAAPQPAVDFVILPGGPGKLVAAYSATLDGWPRGVPPLPPHAADEAAFDSSDATFTVGTRRFSW